MSFGTDRAVLQEVLIQLTEKLGPAATVVITPPGEGQRACYAVVASDEGKRGTSFVFQISGRTAEEITNDLFAQIVRWLQDKSVTS